MQFSLAPSVLVSAVAGTEHTVGTRRARQQAPVSRWANRARVFGVLSLLPLVGVVAVASGVLGLLDIRQHPAKQGTGRAVFGVIVGAITSLLWGSVGLLVGSMYLFSGWDEAGQSGVSAASPGAGMARADDDRLGNGLRVRVRPVQGTPNVALLVLYSIGGDHDPEGASGLAHLIEHLYVTAAAGSTPARSADSFMQAYPAGWNAQTGDRFTVIATVFPREQLDAELTEAAARMNALRVDEPDLLREIPRVVSEVQNMFGGMPQLAAYNHARERLRPTALGGRKGGLPEQVQKISLETVRERCRKYYKPKNAILAVVGDLDPAEARRAIELHFAAVPPGEPVPEPNEPGKPHFDTIHEIAVQPPFPATTAELAVAYRVPPHDSELFAAFLLHAARLGVHASELHDAPQRFPIEFSTIMDPSTLMISLPLQDNETPAQAVARVDRVLAEIARPALATNDRLVARNRFAIELGTVAVNDQLLAPNLYFVAYATARRAQLGRESIDFAAALDRVTADEFRRAAELYLVPSNRVAIVAKPK